MIFRITKLILPLLVIFINKSEAQILNIDREISNDSTLKKWNLSISANYSSDKLKGNLNDISTRIEIDNRLKNNYVLIGQFNTDATFINKTILQNEGYSQLRIRDNDNRKNSIEGFIQYQWNGTLGMLYRQIIGSNYRLRILEKNNIDCYIGLGGFYEIEKWNYDGVDSTVQVINTDPISRNLYRLNHYWKFAYKLNDKIDISTVSYFQFPINKDFLNLRWYLEFNTNLTISKKVSCFIHWDHIIDNYRVVPISNYYYTFNYGLTLNL
jgi:hypothetical protein